MPTRTFLDFETCGLHGMAVLLQYAFDDSEINLHNLWMEPVGDTLELLERIAQTEIVGFNLAFDYFHFNKLYAVFSMFAEKYGRHEYPDDFVDEIGELEGDARLYPKVIKPKSALDLMLFSRKGPYQTLMSRKDVRIKRVPSQLAFALQRELESRVELDGIYFSRRKDKHAPAWNVYDTRSPEFKDVCLKFCPSGALKVLAQHALGVENVIKFTDIEVDKKWYPYELGYAPYAKAVSSAKKGWKVRYKKDGTWKHRYAWPAVIRHHIEHWGFNDLARKYGTDDVVYTRDLWDHFGRPEANDDDSVLACMVGCVRWRGFNVDLEKIKIQRQEALKRTTDVPIAPTRAKPYIAEAMDEIERTKFTSTKKTVLETVADWKCDCNAAFKDDDDMPDFMKFGDIEIKEEEICSRCNGTKVHPAAERAKKVIQGRKALKEVELYDKILQAGRFHASFNVIGTLSSRMSGADGLNAQGINHKTEVRDCFTLADQGFLLCGGDFDSFEVVLADAAYNDEALRRDLTQQRPCQKCDQTGVVDKLDKKTKEPTGEKVKCDECNGTRFATYKIHGLFAMELYPGKTYADVIKSKGTSKDMYTSGKSGVFAMIYGGDWNTLVQKQGIAEDVAKKAYDGFAKRYPGIGRARETILNMFCSMQQPKGIGGPVLWADPADYIESLMGFRRYFTLENSICRALFILANRPPKPWKEMKIKVTRREGQEQFVGGATSSALYGAAFSIQSANMRAAANHVIQSSGATITKNVQRRVWDLQPAGAHDWLVVPLNIHDELMVPACKGYEEAVKKIVLDTVESYRDRVPLIQMEWATGASSWAAAK